VGWTSIVIAHRLSTVRDADRTQFTEQETVAPDPVG
jgi:ABC-type multidrug transport system fused ATPase/permease subunit